MIITNGCVQEGTMTFEFDGNCELPATQQELNDLEQQFNTIYNSITSQLFYLTQQTLINTNAIESIRRRCCNRQFANREQFVAHCNKQIKRYVSKIPVPECKTSSCKIIIQEEYNYEDLYYGLGEFRIDKEKKKVYKKNGAELRTFLPFKFKTPIPIKNGGFLLGIKSYKLICYTGAGNMSYKIIFDYIVKTKNCTVNFIEGNKDFFRMDYERFINRYSI